MRRLQQFEEEAERSLPRLEIYAGEMPAAGERPDPSKLLMSAPLGSCPPPTHEVSQRPQ